MSPPEKASAPDDMDLRDVSILVVDDDDDARELMAMVFKSAGAAVTTADSAQAAVDALSRNHMAVLVSDIGMPVEDGYQLIRRIRAGGASGSASKIPAVAVTAFTSRADRSKALAAGFQEHLPKPVDAGALLAVVSRLAASEIH